MVTAFVLAVAVQDAERREMPSRALAQTTLGLMLIYDATATSIRS